MPELTPAQQQAAFLRLLADHQDAHSGLAEVATQPYRIAPARWQIRILNPDHADRDPWPLIRWARSLDAEQLRAMPITDEAWSSVKFDAEIGPHAAQVWAPIEGLPRDVTSLTVSDLEYFAAHGTLPEAGEPR